MLALNTLLYFFFINTAIAENLCSSLFDYSPSSIAEKINHHNYQLEMEIHGTPIKKVYMEISSSMQLRKYKNEQGELSLKLIKKYSLPGNFTQREAYHIKESFPPHTIEIHKIGEDIYQVNKWAVLQDVARDFNTGLIKADEHKMRKVINDMIQNLAQKKQIQEAFLFLDVDNLRLVNELPGSHKTGDAYIQLIIKLVSKNLRVNEPNNELNQSHSLLDIGFKNYNGDEFFYILEGVHHPKELIQIKSRIENHLKNSPELFSLKQKAQKDYFVFLNQLKEFNSYVELEKNSSLLSYIESRATWLKLSKKKIEEIKHSKKSFQDFISSYINSAEAKKIAKNIIRIELGASIAMDMVKRGDDLESVLARTDKKVKEEKAQKKASPTYSQIEKNDIYFPVFN